MVLNHRLEKYNVILASQSPRRQHLLTELGVSFEVSHGSNNDESYPSNLPYNHIPEFLAKKKAEPLLTSLKSNDILITADTIVWCENSVVGKPINRDDAVRILKLLSGRKHVVVTGVSISNPLNSKSFTSETDVFFRDLTDEEIGYYIDTFKPFDKAGAYGIQEWIGYVGIESINGSYFNVMGLPVQKLYCELIAFLNEIEK